MSISYLFPADNIEAVSARTDHNNEPSSSEDDDGQLEFDLGDRALRLLKIAIMDTIHGRRLTTLVDELTPEFVIDLRDVLRFDLPGMSRDAFFHRLSARGVHYARAPIAWHDISAYGVTTDTKLPIRLYHEAVERWGGNLILLVSRPEHAIHMHAMLNMALSVHRSQGWSIERIP